MREAKARAMAAKTDVLERLRACHKEAQSAIRTALEVDERDGGACLSVHAVARMGVELLPASFSWGRRDVEQQRKRVPV